MAALNGATVASTSLSRLAEELHFACLNYRSARRLPRPNGPVRLDQLPGPTTEQVAAREAVRAIGERLHATGGLGLMARVYDEVVETHGYHGAFGANAAWSGIGGAWWA